MDDIKGYDYNKHLSQKGNTKSSRRWQRGKSGDQKEHIRITTNYDKEWSSVTVPDDDDDDDEDTMKYFEHLGNSSAAP